MSEFSTVLSTLSIPSGVAAIVGLIVFLIKQQPITFLTSTSIEKLLYSKEKKIVIQVLLYIVHSLISGLFISYLTWLMYYFKLEHSLYVSIPTLSVIILCFIYFSICSWVGKNFEQVFGSKTKRTRVIVISSCLGYMGLAILLPAYFIASEVLRSIDTKNSQYELIGTTLIFALLFSLFVILPIIKVATKFMKDNRMPSLYIKESDQTWYIYHYVDKDKLLFGDHPELEQSTKFIIRDRVEVLKSNVLHKELQDT